MVNYSLEEDAGTFSSINSTGTAITIEWNSAADQPGYADTDYQIRITPSDSELGTSGESTTFPVDNI